MLSGVPLLPDQVSTLAFDVDHRYLFVTAVTAFFALLVVIRGVVFAIQSRDRTGGRVSAVMTASIPLELTWSILPFLTSIAIFAWATVAFFDRVRAPEQTLEIHSTSGDGCSGSNIAADSATATSYNCRSDSPSR